MRSMPDCSQLCHMTVLLTSSTQQVIKHQRYVLALQVLVRQHSPRSEQQPAMAHFGLTAILAAVLFTLVLRSASAQSSTIQSLKVVNAASYSRLRTIQAYVVNLYQLNTNSTSDVTDPQLKIVVNATGNGSAPVYCNPLWGSPQPNPTTGQCHLAGK